jgi:hypothetical protein
VPARCQVLAAVEQAVNPIPKPTSAELMSNAVRNATPRGRFIGNIYQ